MKTDNNTESNLETDFLTSIVIEGCAVEGVATCVGEYEVVCCIYSGSAKMMMICMIQVKLLQYLRKEAEKSDVHMVCFMISTRNHVEHANIHVCWHRAHTNRKIEPSW